MKEIGIHFFLLSPSIQEITPPSHPKINSICPFMIKIKVKKMLLLVLSWDKLIYILMLDNHPHKKNKLILTNDIKK